ncbi:hypothetical protein QOZ84_16250 [Romboutsia sedimentorum]|uniref:Uncharacterized protein n=1 Tax=Romboutsia sedimentorum TaxID=1368474 RepID=A0ABT7EDU1_9FIRM|nr:hypothetical protein [Romboutsia sedimentorum]MDK2565083.1 hypothetical protein [Romboutsia sedimentorum]MDK2587513.1 hypothetical protein [Romboutsia sedimentorum]
MSKYKDWKTLDWIITGIVAISFLLVPDWLVEHNTSIMVTVYDYPYNIPIMIAGVFLIYCFLSGVYWIVNKKIHMVVHYCLIATACITITMVYIIAYNSGM